MTDEPICCGVHPETVAGWQCSNESCRQPLCGKCTARLLKLFTCCTCGGAARPLTVSRKAKSRAYWFAAAVRYPFGAGLPLALAMAVGIAVLGFVASLIESHPHQLDGIAAAARICLAASYVLVTIDRTARGDETGKLQRFARTLVATLLLWLPIVLHVVLLGVPGAAAQHDWALWLFAALTLSYLPLVLAVAVTDISFIDVANPFRMFDYMLRLGKTYVVTLVAAILLVALSIVAAAAAAAIRQAIPTPVLRDAVAQLPMLAGLAMLGHVIGMLAHVHGDSIGWGSAELFVDPVFPDMVAEGRRKLATRSAGEPSADAAPTTTSPIALIPPRERSDAAKLSAALKAEELARALRIYESRDSWNPASIEDRHLVMLAKAAARGRKLPLAQRLLAEACGRSGRSVGPALLALAQLHADVLKQPDKAREIYAKVVSEFPGTDVAKLAAAQLGNGSPAVTA